MKAKLRSNRGLTREIEHQKEKKNNEGRLYHFKIPN